MLGTLPQVRERSLFLYGVDWESRIAADHPLRRLAAILNLDFVLPAVRGFYGRSGHVSLDPRVIVKMMVLLFYYDIPSERDLLEQLPVRLDWLWFLGFDLETVIPDHSVLSKARARWGSEVFERLFTQTVLQCVEAGLVDGRLLHIDSTTIKANASKATVVKSSPELVSALRQAYQQQAGKLEVVPDELKTAASPSAPPATDSASAPVADPVSPSQTGESVVHHAPSEAPQPASKEAQPKAPNIQVLPPPAKPAPEASQPTAKGLRANTEAGSQKLPVNRTHISLTDPEAELARSKNGLTELNYKDHRLVDDAHGVITAVAATAANVADGTQLPALVEQHGSTTGLKLGQVTIAGDGHYGTASNYIFCAEEGIRAHLAQVSAHVAEKGKLPLSQFTYEPGQDRLRCPEGHYLVPHQQRPEEQLTVYLIEDPASCAQCPLRKQCTESARGRTIQRHVQAHVVEAAQEEAKSPAGRYSRKRRRHVMEGSFADAANNHGAKKARWRGLGRQRIQGYLIAAVQNLRICSKGPTAPRTTERSPWERRPGGRRRSRSGGRQASDGGSQASIQARQAWAG